MKLLFLIVTLFCSITSASAENLGTFKIAPHSTETVTYSSDIGQVFAFKVLKGPELPDGVKGFEFGWKKQAVYCQGKDCSKAGGFLLFCSVGGVVSGEMKNLSDAEFEVQIERAECEGKDAGSIRCPRPSTMKAMCG